MFQHNIANKFYKPKPLDDSREIKLCPCCNHITNVEEISLLATTKEMEFLGCGIPMFFGFLRFCFFYMLFLGLITGIYSLYTY